MRKMKTLDLIIDVKNVYSEKIKNSPYYINILDDFFRSENVHSRILAKFLQYKDKNGRFVILQSLLEYITKQTMSEEWKNLTIKEPLISQETNRIDLWIKDKDYTIIFENKINRASDRPNQLARYINIALNSSYTEQQIFVVYLPREDKQEPSANSWLDPNTEDSYAETYQNRYVLLSFKGAILPWLKDEVLPKIEKMEVNLRKSLICYIHRLDEELSDIGSGELTVRDILTEKYSQEPFVLENVSAEEIEQRLLSGKTDINEKCNAISEILDIAEECLNPFPLEDQHNIRRELKSLRELLKEMRWKVFYDTIAPDYENQNWETIKEVHGGRNVYFGYKIKLDEALYNVYIGSNARGDDTRYFCSVLVNKEYKGKISTEHRQLFSVILKETGRDEKWMAGYYNEGDYTRAVQLLCEVLDVCKRYQH